MRIAAKLGSWMKKASYDYDSYHGMKSYQAKDVSTRFVVELRIP